MMTPRNTPPGLINFLNNIFGSRSLTVGEFFHREYTLAPEMYIFMNELEITETLLNSFLTMRHQERLEFAEYILPKGYRIVKDD